MVARYIPTHLPHVALDPLLIVVFLALSVYEWRWYWPRMVRRIGVGEPGARVRAYRNIMIAEWAGVAWIAALWILERRPWSALRLGPASPWRVAIGLGVAALYLGLALTQRRALLARPEVLERLRRRLDYAEPMIPRTTAERWLFPILALTAGVCEEIVCRGFMMWYFGAWGPVAAVALSSVVFGLGHLYLGVGHVLRTTLIGVVFALLAMACGSLLPGILLHAAMDWVSGDVGYHAYAERVAGPVAGPESSPA